MGFQGRAGDASTWFVFTGFTTPPTVFRYDLATGETSVFRRPKVDFDPSAFETVRTFATSRDGTRVPLFLTYRKGLARDGRNPTVLTGYGGFDIATTPNWSTAAAVWMERGGIWASACLRGGGEYGREWHLAGTKLRKQNVFDDFVAAAEHLIAEGWTSTPRLAISGGSNGGLLVGAVMTQRPDLFGACLPAVGVLDMLRYHRFTIGWAWASDYGTVDDPEEFRALLAYSPLHNLRRGTCYPPTLVTTGDHDDRVVPAHSFKFAAALQEAQGCANPVLVRVETRAGHGMGKPTSMLIEEAADRWAFLVRVLGR
jgi:prolyl oligopeptidase